MKKGFFIFFFLFTFPLSVSAAQFTLCEGTFALCTTAECKMGKSGYAVCKCDVQSGFSAGTKACEPVEKTADGKKIYSRYYPIKKYVSCDNARPWAWCLDSPCTIDKKNPNKANCKCKIVENKGEYVVVTNNKYNAETCHTDLWSSALVSDVKAITAFLESQSELKPFPIQVQKGE